MDLHQLAFIKPSPTHPPKPPPPGRLLWFSTWTSLSSLFSFSGHFLGGLNSSLYGQRTPSSEVSISLEAATQASIVGTLLTHVDGQSSLVQQENPDAFCRSSSVLLHLILEFLNGMLNSAIVSISGFIYSIATFLPREEYLLIYTFAFSLPLESL